MHEALELIGADRLSLIFTLVSLVFVSIAVISSSN